MKVVSIHQPAYLPWLGYFHKLLLADTFVVLDSTQFEKNSFINRNRIRTANGWSWLTIPILTKGHLEKSIREMEWDPRQKWQRKHLATLRQAYARAPHADRYLPVLEELIGQAESFDSLLMRMLTFFAAELGAETRIVRASELRAAGHKTDLLLAICEELGADVYVAGKLGAGYLDHETFDAAGVAVHTQEYEHPVYAQAHPGFEPYMSVIDCMMMHGGTGTRAIVMRGNLSRVELERLVAGEMPANGGARN
jgi:hypothetical protein